MELVRLYPSDRYEFTTVIQACRLILPFYALHSEAQQAMLDQLQAEQSVVYVVMKKQIPLFL